MRNTIKVICALAFVVTAAAVEAETLTIGAISDNKRKQLARFQPLITYLEAELADKGIDRVNVNIPKTVQDAAQDFRDEELDLIVTSPFSAAMLGELAQGELFLRQWKKGVPEYHSVVVVPKDSPVQNLSDLADMVVGFQDNESTSGFLLPAYLIDQSGGTLEFMVAHDSAQSAGTVGYVFTQDDDNTLLWLAKGWIDAGAFDRRSFSKLEQARPDEFRVLARSIDVPRQILTIRPGFDPDLANHIKDVFRNMHLSEEGRDVLVKFHRTAKFDDFPSKDQNVLNSLNVQINRLQDLNLF